MSIEASHQLFDGETLKGWTPVARVYGTDRPGGDNITDLMRAQGYEIAPHPERHPAHWGVEEGAIVGRQETPGGGYGGYLLSDAAYGDFELTVEANPDWPADTGIMVRRLAHSWEGFQVLLDHRPHGGIAGFFGNGLASFSAVPFTVDAQYDAEGRAVGLVIEDDGVREGTRIAHRRAVLDYACDAQDFLDAWKWADWNEIRVRCVGHLPVLTTWVNGVKIAQLDTARIEWPGYDPDAVRETLNSTGHLALEVHDNDPITGLDRWGVDAACRWRNLTLKEL